MVLFSFFFFAKGRKTNQKRNKERQENKTQHTHKKRNRIQDSPDQPLKFHQIFHPPPPSIPCALHSFTWKKNRHISDTVCPPRPTTPPSLSTTYLSRILAITLPYPYPYSHYHALPALQRDLLQYVRTAIKHTSTSFNTREHLTSLPSHDSSERRRQRLRGRKSFLYSTRTKPGRRCLYLPPHSAPGNLLPSHNTTVLYRRKPATQKCNNILTQNAPPSDTKPAYAYFSYIVYLYEYGNEVGPS